MGVCLGHQSIGEAFGGKIVRAGEILHGKVSEIDVDTSSPLFEGLPEKITVGRYHSLIIENESLPEELVVTARAEKGEIMAVQHKTAPTFGVQFHPESILTPNGLKMIENFLNVK